MLTVAVSKQSSQPWGWFYVALETEAFTLTGSRSLNIRAVHGTDDFGSNVYYTLC
jgi:hypothetical protein